MGKWSCQERSSNHFYEWLADRQHSECSSRSPEATVSRHEWLSKRVVLGLTLSYAVQAEEFIQVLHIGHGHWVTVSTVGCKDGEIHIFDSFPPAPTSHLMNQIAVLLPTPKPAITVNYMDTQMQCGSTDGSIFAITFATALANGGQPEGFIFNSPGCESI